MNSQSHKKFSVYIGLVLSSLFLRTATADLNDAEKAEEQARKHFAERYLEFTQDKNVMGKAMSVDGKVQSAPSKSRFDADDGVSYKSDLTYHDFAYFTEDEGNNKKAQGNGGNKPNDPNAKNSFRLLQPFVSPHGGLSEAGGSSVLERTMYEQFDKLSKEDQNQKGKKNDEKEGIENKGVFKITTKQIFEQPDNSTGANGKPGGSSPQASNGGAQPSGNSPKKDKEKETVQRWELREEAKQAVQKVGKDSAETVIQAARDKESKEDQNALPFELFLYDASAKATTSLWNAQMANLYQRRIFKGLSEDAMRPKLSEENPDCESWAKKQQEEIAKLPKDQQEKAQKDFELTKKGCDQMSKMPFTAVNPGYEVDPNNSKVEVLKERGPEKEDALSRDMRVQMELMSSAGKSINDVKSNWKYDENAEKVELKDGDETVQQNMAEQLESYNKQLEDAKAAYNKIQEAASDTFKSKIDPDQYRIEPETRSVMEINKRPGQAFQDFGVDSSKLDEPVPAQNYEELIKNVK